MNPDYRCRNRESQRRARARRCEYIQELEEKVSDYERRGVQATVWMQAAARRVAQENSILRELLTESGLPKEAVDQYVAVRLGIRQTISEAISPSTMDATVEDDTHIIEMNKPSSENGAVLNSAEEDLCSNCHDGCSIKHSSRRACIIEKQPDYTDCEEAARIITSMRGRTVAQDVWESLGCACSTSCYVQNSLVFELAAGEDRGQE